MKRFYVRFRIMLMALALGLASVGFVNWLSEYWSEVPVELPKVESNSSIIVFPREDRFIPKVDYGENCKCAVETYSKNKRKTRK